MKTPLSPMDSEKWTGHAEPVDRYVLALVLLAGAVAFLVVGLFVL